MRWIGWLAVFASACAGGGKMAWPPASDPIPARRAEGGGGARGGPAEPMAEEPVTPPLRMTAREPPKEPALELSGAVTFIWPVPATGVNSLFGHRRDPVDGTTRYHAGVDLDAAYGAVISAAAAGWVSSAGWHAGHGRRVVLEHAGGFQTVYSHLSQVLAVTGTWVRPGEPIGRVGNSGRSTGPHLHLEVNRWGQHLDPLDYLGVTVGLDD